ARAPLGSFRDDARVSTQSIFRSDTLAESAKPESSQLAANGLPLWVFDTGDCRRTSSNAADTSHSLLTIKEAAVLLRVSQRTVRRLIDRGEIEALRIGRSVRLNRAAIEQMLEHSPASYQSVSRPS
ncbi:MAG: Helix-turn-helix domain, partial [Pseudomonadota bacterium]